MTAARLLEAGLLPPPRLHAGYAGIAQAARPDSAPVLLWGRASAHISLGQSQSAACELVARPAVPVLRRPLGGGTVWIDEQQQIYVFIVPLQQAPRRPAEWAAWGLRPAVATFRAFGLDVERRGEDLWLGGRKIAGSGAATIGGCAVFASSFLMRFPHERFAGCVAGSAGFRGWLSAGLAATMTDWSSHGAVPAEARLRASFVAATEKTFHWQLRADVVRSDESAAITEAEAGMREDDDDCCGVRAVTGGIKLNRESRLVEHEYKGRLVRELVVRGMVARRAVMTPEQGAV
ncbi:MAG: lipoate--protein ligase family protein [Burkholderiales bacterium]|nr:lipoate--protein ligase family protein [Burkholderiales bacterium]